MKFSLPQAHVLGVVLFLGMLTMGFQLLASRLLAPYFGSSIIVWAWLISTFLAAFAIGSLFGGFVANMSRGLRMGILWGAALVCVSGFALNAIFGRSVLDYAATNFASLHAGLFLSCVSLFFPPVLASSVFSPVCVGFVSAQGWTPGLSSGLIYGVSTLGNIAGVMLTAFFLVPNYAVSELLLFWMGLAILCILALSPIFGKVQSKLS